MQRIDIDDNNYSIRGRRVPHLTEGQISGMAKYILRYIGINKKNKSDLVFALENMYGLGKFPLIIDVVADDEWCYHGIAEAIWFPSLTRIMIPNTLYEQLADGDLEALHVLLHEVGHCFLAHGLILHRDSNTPPKKTEDSEAQADCFADAVFKLLKLKEDNMQLSLF